MPRWSSADRDPAMTIFEMLVIALAAVLVLAISGVVAPLLGLAPWMLALPVIVLGLWRVLGGRWISAAAAVAFGVWLGVTQPEEPFMPAVAGGWTFWFLRRMGAAVHEPEAPFADYIVGALGGASLVGTALAAFLGLLLGPLRVLAHLGPDIFAAIAWWLLIPCVVLDLCSAYAVVAHLVRDSGPTAVPMLSWAYYVLFSLFGLQVDWRCPSARATSGARFILPYGDWLGYLRASEGSWGMALDEFGPCWGAWPPGWGGEVTDSIAQNRYATGWLGSVSAANKVFTWGYSTNGDATKDKKLAAIQQPTSFVIVADGGWIPNSINPGTLVAPELCLLSCSGCSWYWVDWEVCTDASGCGLYSLAPNNGSFLREPALRKPYARHLGGNNLGFLDGHAQWIDAERSLVMVREGDLQGIDITASGGQPNSLCGAAEAYPDQPLLF